MSGKLSVDKVTLNSIFVTWNVSCYASTGVVRNSPSFALATNGRLVTFLLSMSCSNDCSLTVEKTSSGTGRGIVSLAIMGVTGENTMKLYLNEKWEQTCLFKNIATLTSNQYTYIEVGCKITWLGFIDDVTTPENPLLLQSVENLSFDNTVRPDFTIVVEGQEIPSHKAILAHYSPVLSVMFESEMKESEENKMIIEDFEYSTIKLLLNIMYSGKGDLSDIDTTIKVFQAAEKYQISKVKNLCECKLQLKIQADNVLMLLEQADKYDAAQLCESCVMYIFAAKDDKLSSEFQKIAQKPNIAFAVMNAFMGQFLLSAP